MCGLPKVRRRSRLQRVSMKRVIREQAPVGQREIATAVAPSVAIIQSAPARYLSRWIRHAHVGEAEPDAIDESCVRSSGCVQ